MSKTILAIIITFVVTFIGTSLLWGAVILFGMSTLSGSAPDFRVQIDAPDMVQVSETFQVVVSVTNPTDHTVEIGSIDVYHSFLEGFEFVGASPAPADVEDIWDFKTFWFNHTLDPGERRDYALDLRALTPGVWSGDVDVCTPEENFITNRLVVRVN